MSDNSKWLRDLANEWSHHQPTRTRYVACANELDDKDARIKELEAQLESAKMSSREWERKAAKEHSNDR